MFITKRILKTQIEELNTELTRLYETFPFELGQIVYDVQLRNSKGRFTKTKACKEHSFINEVEVNEKNYFNLVKRLHELDVFIEEADAIARLDDVCVE